MAKELLSANDCSKMMFQVHELSMDVDLCSHFQELSLYTEFINYRHKLKNQVIRFIFYAYDANSPFMRITDATHRRNTCMELAGITDKAMIKKLHESSDEKIVGMIKCFINRIQNNRKLQKYIALEKNYQEMIDQIYNSVEEGDKKDPVKLQNALKIKSQNAIQCDEMEAQLNKLENELFPQFQDTKKFIETDKEGSVFSAGAAENMVKKKQTRKKPILYKGE